jgi:hypothetical protein
VKFRQHLAKTVPRPMHENTDRVDRDVQLLGDLLIAPVLEAVKAECHRLVWRDLSQGPAELIGQFGDLDILRRRW